MIDLEKELQRRQAEHLYRRRRVVDSAQGAEIVVDGRRLLSFCSNDYLGLANHPEVIAAMQRGAAQYGAGSGAAHLVTGHMTPHHALEEELAAFTGYARALLFSTGYMANLGAVSALCGAGDAVFEDRLNHASLLDAGLLSRARLQRFPHGDVSVLGERLAESKAQRKLIVTDGVFSMDGDIAPLRALADAAQQHDAWLMMDDAHGLGVIGEHGRGSMEVCGITPRELPLLVGTLGKGFGSFGAFVAADEVMIETLIQQARPYIYTTALPPAVAEATRASLRVIQSDEGAARRAHLAALVQRFRDGAQQLGLKLMESPTAIQPLLVGDSATAVRLSEALLAEGILISAIRPPTVPDGTARLRITLSAAHTTAQVDRLLDALQEITQ
ncbi:MAG: 8-amino-7-oxononanoate synthase [Gammaproteobacteria bacterium HGW-Gammaproteobacteria-1]|jgi:8-amino-7-oxononanoate synthase|nr:MAG: 8-amino-7-oxononanoate synthase [Gammaproteobacteria bacterium HGW-Gammaproteobacteria-1]